MNLFPFKPREEQKRMLSDWRECVKEGKSMLAHAPTGIGKTAAALAPSLEYALENHKTIFFLTSRHSQHKIAIDTLKLIRRKFDVQFSSLDLIGKRWMCPVEGIQDLSSREFKDFCDSTRKNESCPFYNETLSDGILSRKAKDAMARILKKGPLHFEECLELCEGFCPYYIMMNTGKKAQVIICDYYHLFNDAVRRAFLTRTQKDLQNSIIIVDEGHNLPPRLRQLLSWRLSQYSVNQAVNEVKKFAPSLLNDIEGLERALTNLEVSHKRRISKEELLSELDEECPSQLFDLIDSLISVGEEIRLSEKRSFLGSIGEFLEAWNEDEKDLSFIRTISTYQGGSKPYTTIHKKCLDPAIASEEVIKSCHACLMMSGTLLPLEMYADLLGFPNNTLLRQYSSPFPDENRLNVIVPTVTSRFSKRNRKQYARFARVISDFLDSVPGNSAVFFPSYKLRDAIVSRVSTEKQIIEEKRGMTKAEKSGVLHKLEMLSGTGGALFGVIGGSFSEGVDYPHNLLQSVIVAGVPLKKPTIEVKALIKYYQDKFSKGWDYAYLYPAVNKALQAAGRCIRSSNDRGIVVFMDERYLWKNYRKCFPDNLKLKITPAPQEYVNQFYSR